MQKRSFQSISNLILALCLGISLQASAASTPESLATDLQSALSKGDIDAALVLGDFKNTTPYLKWLYLRNVTECVHDSFCKVSVQADDPSATAEQLEHQHKLGLEYAVKPTGALLLTNVWRNHTPRRAAIRIPYAKIGGQYRVLTERYDAKKLAELRAQTNAQLLNAMFEQGIKANYPQKIFRANWKAAVTALPAGGGQIGAAYASNVAHAFIRYSTGDAAAVLALRDQWAQTQISSETPETRRVMQLRAESVRMLVSVKVLGGYQLGDDVVLETEGIAENGWIVRGPMLLKLDSSGEVERESSFSMTVSYPK